MGTNTSCQAAISAEAARTLEHLHCTARATVGDGLQRGAEPLPLLGDPQTLGGGLGEGRLWALLGGAGCFWSREAPKRLEGTRCRAERGQQPQMGLKQHYKDSGSEFGDAATRGKKEDFTVSFTVFTAM